MSTVAMYGGAPFPRRIPDPNPFVPLVPDTVSPRLTDLPTSNEVKAVAQYTANGELMLKIYVNGDLKSETVVTGTSASLKISI